MEEHRLKPCSELFDRKAFERIRTKVTPLKKNLASQISPKRFGVEYEDILSWFDSKMIFIFNRYWDGQRTEDEILARVIQGLKNFKFRIIRFSYQAKNKAVKVNLEDINEYDEFPINQGTPEQEVIEGRASKMKAVNTALKAILSEDAYEIYQIDLNPPVYILERLQEKGRNLNSRIPAHLIAEFMGFLPIDRGIHYVSELRKQVAHGVDLVAQQAKSNKLPFSA